LLPITHYRLRFVNFVKAAKNKFITKHQEKSLRAACSYPLPTMEEFKKKEKSKAPGSAILNKGNPDGFDQMPHWQKMQYKV